MLNHPISIIGLTEAWLNDINKDSFQLENYNYINSNRYHKISKYVTKNIQFKKRDNLSTTQEEVIESIFVEIMTQTGKNIIIGVIYRPPNGKFDVFEKVMSEILSKNKTKYAI